MVDESGVVGISGHGARIVVTRAKSVEVYEDSRKVRLWKSEKRFTCAAVLSSESWLLACVDGEVKFEKNGNERSIEREALAVGWRNEEAIVVSANGIGIYGVENLSVQQRQELRFSMTVDAAWFIYKKDAVVDGAATYDELTETQDSFPKIVLRQSEKIASIVLPEISTPLSRRFARGRTRGGVYTNKAQTIEPEFSKRLPFFDQDAFLCFETAALHSISAKDSTWCFYDQATGSTRKHAVLLDSISCASICGDALAIGMSDGSLRFYHSRRGTILPLLEPEARPLGPSPPVSTPPHHKEAIVYTIADDSLEVIAKNDTRSTLLSPPKKKAKESIATRLIASQSSKEIAALMRDALRAKDLSPLLLCPRLALLSGLDLFDEEPHTFDALELSFDLFITKVLTDPKATNTLRLGRASLLTHTEQIQALALSLAPALADLRALAASSSDARAMTKDRHFHRQEKNDTTRKNKRKRNSSTDTSPHRNTKKQDALTSSPLAATPKTGSRRRHRRKPKRTTSKRYSKNAHYSSNQEDSTPLLLTETFQLS